MRSFSHWVGVDKDTGTIFAEGSELPTDGLRRWSVADEREYPHAKRGLPPKTVLVAAADPKASYCYGVDVKEAEKAKLLPEQ
jgi:hypothetical protein